MARTCSNLRREETKAVILAKGNVCRRKEGLPYGVLPQIVGRNGEEEKEDINKLIISNHKDFFGRFQIDIYTQHGYKMIFYMKYRNLNLE